MITIIELPSFRKATKKWLTEAERFKLHHTLQSAPESGDVIQGTGGARKLRVAAGGKGKSGGARVIYYYHVSDTEILLITAYTKGKKEDLSAAEKKEIKKLINLLKEESGT